MKLWESWQIGRGSTLLIWIICFGFFAPKTMAISAEQSRIVTFAIFQAGAIIRLGVSQSAFS